MQLIESEMLQTLHVSVKLHARPYHVSLLLDAVRRAQSCRQWNLYFRSCRDAEDFCLLL